MTHVSATIDDTWILVLRQPRQQADRIPQI